MGAQGPCQRLERGATQQRWLSAHASQEGARPGLGIVTETALRPRELTVPRDRHGADFSVPHTVSLELPWKRGG